MHIKPKKNLGQNFLVDGNIQRKIIAACSLQPKDNILEIGAGSGLLTGLLAAKAASVYALEIDAQLTRILKEKFSNYKNIKIINQDILKFNFKRYFSVFVNKPKVIGNIPYYITTPIIEYLIKQRANISTIFLTVQKEFAKRITASTGSKDYGSFSCFVQYYFKPKALFFIKKGCFRPMPKVDSCFLELKVREKPEVKVKDEKLLFRVIRLAFNQRRKALRNSLKRIIAQKNLEQFFKKYRHLSVNARAEELSLADFANLLDFA